VTTETETSFLGLKVQLRAATTVAVMLVGLTCFLCFMTALSIGSTDCAGRTSVAEYRTAASNLLAVPVFGLAILALFAVMGSGRQRKKLEGQLTTLDLVVFRVFSMHVTLGMVMIYAMLWGLVLMAAMTTAISFFQYRAIATSCGMSG